AAGETGTGRRHLHTDQRCRGRNQRPDDLRPEGGEVRCREAGRGAPQADASRAGLKTRPAGSDTQIGVQNYTYDFKVDGGKLTGPAKSQFSESPITEGSVKGDAITFVENLTFQDMPIRIVYTGTISGDEIKFNRKVGDFASEDFVAKRARQPGSHGNRNSY